MPDDSPTDADPERSAELVRRAQGGDRAAFDALIRKNTAKLSTLVRKRMGKELRQVEESADLVQSALAEAVRCLPDFEYRGEGSFLRWLSMILENRIRMHARAMGRAKRRPDAVVRLEQDPVAPDPSPSQLARGQELEQRYQQALDQLPQQDKELLLLHLELGCSYGEIADALGVPTHDSVRKRVARALARLEITMGGGEA